MLHCELSMLEKFKFNIRHLSKNLSERIFLNIIQSSECIGANIEIPLKKPINSMKRNPIPNENPTINLNKLEDLGMNL